MKRSIITIDEELCTGCGQCVPDCPEGALQVIEGKARLVSDLFCDGLGACIGTCPEGAISVIEREAEPYDEWIVMGNIARQGEAVIRAHLEHLAHHGEAELYSQALAYLEENRIAVPDHDAALCAPGSAGTSDRPFAGCPGVAPRVIEMAPSTPPGSSAGATPSELRQWPIQLGLQHPDAAYFENADLLITGDCVPFAHPDFHREFLEGRILIMFCPKLDAEIEEYVEKLAGILSRHRINSITVVHMEVPCCSGTRYIVDRALEHSGSGVPVTEHTVSIRGEILPP
ncbi:MAG: 4Fe-4S binding protein [Methanospirillum sp.]|nr:4Fe-4S binding protein [Methanospirillum sp.]